MNYIRGNDLKIYLDFQNNGISIDPTSVAWELKVFTIAQFDAIVCGRRRNGELYGDITIREGKILLAVDDPTLVSGRLNGCLSFFLEDDDFPDGLRTEKFYLTFEPSTEVGITATATIDISVVGLSAYKIALLNGFVGSETEWLASLKGDKGEPGADADIEGCNEAIANANKATANALTATADAKTATINAQTATTNAETATTDANTATANALTATELAKTATKNADTATAKAETATADAQTAIDNAETATADAQTATTDAIKQATYAKEQGDYAKEQGDYAGEQGVGLKDYKNYMKINILPDYGALPLLCGQPPILIGDGTPQSSVVPINWRQFDPESGEGYNWNGTPSAIGQQYINRSASDGGRYIAIPDPSNPYFLIWKNL